MLPMAEEEEEEEEDNEEDEDAGRNGRAADDSEGGRARSGKAAEGDKEEDKEAGSEEGSERARWSSPRGEGGGRLLAVGRRKVEGEGRSRASGRGLDREGLVMPELEASEKAGRSAELVARPINANTPQPTNPTNPTRPIAAHKNKPERMVSEANPTNWTTKGGWVAIYLFR